MGSISPTTMHIKHLCINNSAKLRVWLCGIKHSDISDLQYLGYLYM